jgi:hypothetical protein
MVMQNLPGRDCLRWTEVTTMKAQEEHVWKFNSRTVVEAVVCACEDHLRDGWVDQIVFASKRYV